MSIKAIQDAVSKSHRDSFPFGTVIRWSAGPYLYAAIKTPAGWSTTSRTGNRFVPQTLTFSELLEILARAETTDVRVSSTWLPIE